jgi:aryl-alcohol dehydrogenase-like predicted oxidoreductase
VELNCCKQLPFRKIEVPMLKRMLSNIMAHPSSAEPDTHGLALDEYARLGGNCIHLHDEVGEPHTRRVTGHWIQQRGLRPEFFLCTQICHSGWDKTAGRTVDRFTAASVREDIDADLELLGSREASFEPVIDAIAKQIELKRVRAYGIRNWDAKRLSAAQTYVSSTSLPQIAGIVTTEFSLAIASAPVWPEYVPFDRELRQMVEAQRLPVFAPCDRHESRSMPLWQ